MTSTAPSAPPARPRLLRLPEVLHLTGYGRDSIYRLGRVGKFPQRVNLSARAARWREDEIVAWIEERSAERGGQRGPSQPPTNEMPPQMPRHELPRIQRGAQVKRPLGRGTNRRGR